jgi:imidazolonepropionase-like amidohydrolase
MSHPEFAITNVRLFDGDAVHDGMTVSVADGKITSVRDTPGAAPEPETVDGSGMTLLPGLIDSHAHAKPPALELALMFGVTTELDMFSMPEYMLEQRRDAAQRNDLADVRSASVGATVLGGHPSMMIGTLFDSQFPVLETEADVVPFLDERAAEGADYIKLFIDDGHALGMSGPTMTEALATRLTRDAHARGLLVVAHALSADGTEQALRAGVDGLVHIFFDVPPTDEIIEKIVASGAFITPTLTIISTATGHSGATLADDARSRPFLPNAWHGNMHQCFELNTPGNYDNAVETVRRLHAAGVPLLAGTDAAIVGVPGAAHGINLHGELQMLVEAGLSPIEALRAATSVPARLFGLADRGNVKPGLQADLLLVEGDPTSNIDATLSIAGVWRRGHRLDRESRVREMEAASGPSPVD